MRERRYWCLKWYCNASLWSIQEMLSNIKVHANRGNLSKTYMVSNNNILFLKSELFAYELLLPIFCISKWSRLKANCTRQKGNIFRKFGRSKKFIHKRVLYSKINSIKVSLRLIWQRIELILHTLINVSISCFNWCSNFLFGNPGSSFFSSLAAEIGAISSLCDQIRFTTHGTISV